ncbi:MAG: BON domain-containing protein [Pseudomonadota bacterium]|nr:BON domain-containing protein [Pseudomonadota bacterium]
MSRPTIPRQRGPALRRFAAAALLLAALAGCAPLLVGGAVVGGALVVTDRRTTGAQLDDETIELKANSRMNTAFGDDARVNITSYNRMVLLTGEVPRDADKTIAEQAVARIDNVQSVVNELTVGQSNTFSEKTKDAFVTAKVKASLIDAKDLFANSIKVVTHRGTVYLMGRVTEREATRAAEVARGVAGVVKVVRVFEILSDSELANSQSKSPVRPDNRAVPPGINPSTPVPEASSSPVKP